MNEVKKGLLQKIADKVARKKALQKEMASRKTDVAKFAMTLLREMEDMLATSANASLIEDLAPLYAKSLQERLRVLDNDVSATLSWENNQVSGILIKWSPDYQAANNCDPELYVDIAELLFKD